MADDSKTLSMDLIGPNITKLRATRGLSIRDVAGASMIDEDRLLAIEGGASPTLIECAPIAEVLDVSAGDLLTGEKPLFEDEFIAFSKNPNPSAEDISQDAMFREMRSVIDDTISFATLVRS